ncbi:hypothetical protein FQR65_LT16939 [Abscondita terminalis]|nr:hypothetical protein FQR65_LT16939 [Abscondita terminalis]
MEKEHSESMTSIPIKAEYAASEVYSSEPPPAYRRPKSSAVQIAKITAVTVVLVSIILGGFILASAYVSATASCKQLEQELQLLTETADRLQPLQPEALVQDEQQAKELTKPANKIKEIDDNNVHEEHAENNNENPDSGESDDEEEKVTPIHIKLPLHLDLDDIAGSIIDKNQRSKMNCIVEKKRAEEVVDHKPKSIQLPFGLNLTTDPRVEHVTGERMTHSSATARGTRGNGNDPTGCNSIRPPDTFPNPHASTNAPNGKYASHTSDGKYAIHGKDAPIQSMETMRPPMPGPIMQQQQQPQIQVEQVQAVPNPFIQQIVQQLIHQRIRMEMLRAQEEVMRVSSSEQREDSQNSNEVREQPEAPQMPQIVMAHKLPIPDEFQKNPKKLRNDMVNNNPRESSEEMNPRQGFARGIPVHIPVPMMQSQESSDSPQVSSAASNSNEEIRPHYVQPRSVRSVDALLPKNEKRLKRCACDCAC